MSAPSTLRPKESPPRLAARRRESVIWGIIHFFGSLKMAVLLLSTIALACAIATFTESGFNTKVAQYYIYKSPWFLCWLGVLGLNLFCVTLTRWPWQPHHRGFVLTHFGIITLLIGAVVGRLSGFEAFMTLDQGQAPEARAIIQESMLTMQLPTTGSIVGVTLPVEADPPSPQHPRDILIPATGWKIRIRDYCDHLQEKERLADPAPLGFGNLDNLGPGVALAFHSQMMQQEQDLVILRDSPTMSERDFFGRAKIEWAKSPWQLPIPSGPLWKEAHMLFALHPEATVVETTQPASGWKLSVQAQPSTNGYLVTARSPGAKSTESWTLASLQDQPVLLPDHTGQLRILGFWPNFAMRDGRPVSLSDQPVNPAVLAEIGSIDPSLGPKQPTLRLFPNQHGGVDYQLRRGWTPYQQGELRLNSPISLGWADWQLTLKQQEAEARMETVYEKPAINTGNRFLPQVGIPGIQACLVDENGQVGPACWVASGTSQNVRLGTVAIPVAFGLRTQLLPFEVSLVSFEIPRYEGTDNPANFISTLHFDDLATGHSLTDTASMNKPASFPGGFWRSVFGQNYKFSQASWNPQNLKETTVQILYDPGWPFKWIGSLMVVIGIFTLFYLRPRARS